MEVELTIFAGYDEGGEMALSEALEASKILRREYGIHAYIIPRNIMIHDPLFLSMADLPKIYVNGELAFSGIVPSAEEIVDKVIYMLWVKNKNKEPVPLISMQYSPTQGEAVAQA